MSSTMHQIIEQFAAAMAGYGLQPPEVIADGMRHRFDAPDDRKGKKSAWYVLYADNVPAGAFGNWKTDLSEKWCSSAEQSLTPAERAQWCERIEQAKQTALQTRLQLEKEAADMCARIWAQAQDATNDNPYCQRKGIKPYGLKEFKDKRTLIVPVRNSQGELTSLQFIAADGAKRFKSHGKSKECYYSLGGKPQHTILLCEGFADGASLFAATGFPVAVAFSAGNLEAVARQLRAKYPAIRIIVCADNDRFNVDGNIGVIKARAAALAVVGYVAIPQFEAQENDLHDFNDLHRAKGLLAVLQTVNAAICANTGQTLPSAPPTGQSAQNNQPQRHHQHNGQASMPTQPSDVRSVQIRCAADIAPQPITWLWENWLPSGKLTILAGAAGTGKTTLALGLGAILSNGGTWPDGTPCKNKGKVLIWSSEDQPADTLVPRLMAAEADTTRCFFIDGVHNNKGVSSPFDPARDMPGLHLKVEEMGGISLLIIDPIVSAVEGDMHRANDVRRSLQAIVSFAEQYQCAVIGITHFGKGSIGRAPQERVIGSQAFAALARMVLVAAKEDGSNRRVLARAKSNIAPDEGGVTYRIEQRTVKEGIRGSYPIWEDTIEGSAREILGSVEDDEDSDAGSRQELGQMLIHTLQHAGGKMATKLLKVEVNDAGHSWEYAKKLKKSLGIEAEKQSMVGPWMWCLTGHSSTEKRQQRQKAKSRVSEQDPHPATPVPGTDAQVTSIDLATSAASIGEEIEVMEVL